MVHNKMLSSILALPGEVFDTIILYSVLSRDRKRAFRLRQVSRKDAFPFHAILNKLLIVGSFERAIQSIYR